MPRGAVRRVMKKKDKKHVRRQIKKKASSNTNNGSNGQVKQQQNMLTQMGYMKQQYGNPDLAMQQMRNQTQTYTDQINNYQATIKSMEKERTDKEKELSDMKKDYKEAKKRLKQVMDNYDIARDNQEDIEEFNEKADRLLHKTHSLDIQNIETKKDIDINKMTKREIAMDQEIMKQRLHLERQNKDIEKRKKEYRLKEKEDELRQLKTEIAAAEQYMDSPAFKDAQTTAEQLLMEHMQEEEKKRFLDVMRKNAEEIQKLRRIIDEDPKDRTAIMEYYTKKIAAQERIIGQGKHHREILEDKENDIQYLRRKNQELRNKANEQRIDNEILEEKLSYYRKEDLNENIDGSAKDIVRLNNQIEEKKDVIHTMEAIKQKKKENRELAEEIEEYDRSTKGDKFRQQNEKMVELEMQLEDANIENAKLHQMKSEQKRLDQAQLANEAKGRAISASILQGQGYDEAPVVDQVNNIIDSGSCAQQDSVIVDKSSDSFDGEQLSRSPNPYYSKNDNFEEEEESN